MNFKIKREHKKIICCSLVLSLVQFLFSFVLYSLSYINIKVKIEPMIKLNYNIYIYKLFNNCFFFVCVCVCLF